MQENEINIGQIFRMILMQSKLIILIVFFVGVLSIANYFYTDRVYKVSSLVQVFSQSGNAFSSSFVDDIYASSTNTSDLENIKNLYKSRSNTLQIIERFNLHLSSEDIDNFSFIKKFKALGGNSQFKEFRIDFFEDGFVLSDDQGSSKKLDYGFNNVYLGFEVNLMSPNIELESVDIKYVDPGSMYKNIESRLNVTNVETRSNFYGTRDRGLLEVSYITDDYQQGIEIVNYANDLFIAENIEFESERARKAISFINQRLNLVESDLEDKKINLRDFRAENKTVNVDLEIQSIVENIARIELEIDRIDIEIASASRSYTESNPLFIELLNQKEILLNQRNNIEAEIKNLPLAQQNYIDLFRNVELSEQAYTELLSKRLEFSIKEASTLGNMRVIDSAYIDNIVSPRLNSIIVSVFLAAIFAVLLAIYRGLFVIAVSNPAELNDNGITTPIIGVLHEIDDDDENNERLTQATESLIVNIENLTSEIENSCRTILITSPTAKNGKSFISREAAKKIADLGHKVLLIDGDWKRGDQHKAFGSERISKEKIISLDSDNIDSLKVYKQLHLLTKPMRVQSSFQFLYSKEFQKLVEGLKSSFDYIIIDTAPLLSVSDTSILMSFSDLNIVVARHGITKINELKQTAAVASQIGIEFDGLIYNGYKRPSSYYGYYGLYGNYSYQYYANKYLYENYEYDKEV